MEVIPEVFGGGALPRKELKDAASELTSDQAGLIVVGEATLAGFDKAVTRAHVVKRQLDAPVDEVADELREALKS